MNLRSIIAPDKPLQLLRSRSSHPIQQRTKSSLPTQAGPISKTLATMTSMIFDFFAILLLVASCINGTPVSQEKGSHLALRFTGHATYFAPGTGACGATNSGSDYIVAMNQAQYAGGSLCQKTVSIKNEASGKSVQAKVVDKCPGCAFGSLDLSPTVFSALGDMSAGVLPISWQLE
ncbi:hypothetical protein H4Q26_017451 [Puccinia striiformis f. sp. tritici PST-130]|nr:hypothetical protein H4Q26_017451 [Puccinia striiformis f. sp. tritici PST-130]